MAEETQTAEQTEVLDSSQQTQQSDNNTQAQDTSSRPAFQNFDRSKVIFAGKETQAQATQQSQQTQQQPSSTTQQQAAAAEQPASETTQATTETQNAETNQAPEAEEEEVDFYDYVSEHAGMSIKTPEEVISLAKENAKLKAQLAEKPKIEFENEQHRLLYEYGKKVTGNSVKAGRDMLHAVSLDLKSMGEKDKQFEAYVLSRPEITRERAREIFEAKYDKLYGNGLLESDILAQDQHASDTREAEAKILKMQEEFNQAPSNPAGANQPTAEEIAQVKANIGKVVSEFGGVSYNNTGDKDGAVNVPMDAGEVEKFTSYLEDPGKFFSDLSAEFTDAKGNFDDQAYAVRMYEFMNLGRIREQTWKSGVNYGRLQQIKEAKNTAPPRAPETQSVNNAPKSMKDAWLSATNGQKRK